MADNIIARVNKARTGQIDAAEEAALTPVPTTPVVAPGAGMPPPTKPITTAEAEAKAAKYKAEREQFDTEAKAAAGAPKPGLLKRLGGLFGGS